MITGSMADVRASVQSEPTWRSDWPRRKIVNDRMVVSVQRFRRNVGLGGESGSSSGDHRHCHQGHLPGVRAAPASGQGPTCRHHLPQKCRDRLPVAHRGTVLTSPPLPPLQNLTRGTPKKAPGVSISPQFPEPLSTDCDLLPPPPPLPPHHTHTDTHTRRSSRTHIVHSDILSLQHFYLIKTGHQYLVL